MNDLSTFLSYTALFLIVKWTLSWDNFSTLSMFGEAFICQNQPVGLGFFFLVGGSIISYFPSSAPH